MSVISIKNRTILHGDVLEKLKEIPDGIIDCVISSPPYWGLRDYGVKGQLGLEPDFRDYLKIMGDIMDQLKRVLKSTGSCWINLGDTYAGSGKGAGFDGAKESWRFNEKPKLIESINAKSLHGIPDRFKINCIDSGWTCRNDCTWYKSNAMPTSVKDRLGIKHERVFFFTKAIKYYFNLDAIREKTITETKPFNIRVRENQTGHAQSKLGEKAWTATEEELKTHDKLGQKITKQDQTLGPDGKPLMTYAGFNERWNNKAQDQYTKRILEARSNGAPHDNPLGDIRGKNPGDVLFINPRPFTEAHFATFPLELPEFILKCACPDNGIVLDPFFGSGTVGLAAEKLNKRWIGIELNEDYIKIANNRLSPFINNKLESYV